MILLIDNYDSFTYNLKDYFEQLGEKCLVVRNDELTIEQVKQLNFTKIVLSPGPERPATAGILNSVIKEFYDTVPILGICLGHQAIGEFFGADLEKASKPMHGKVSIVKHNGDTIFNAIPSAFEVCRYHSLIIKNINTSDLESIAETDIGEIMAIKHTSFNVWGVQFHPEAILTKFGLELLNNWLTLAKA